MSADWFDTKLVRSMRPRPLGANWVRVIPNNGADREWHHVNGLWRMRARCTMPTSELDRTVVTIAVTTPERKHYRRNRTFTLVIFADNGSVHPASPFGAYVAGSTDTRIPTFVHAAMTRAASYFLESTLADVPEAVDF